MAEARPRVYFDPTTGRWRYQLVGQDAVDVDSWAAGVTAVLDDAARRFGSGAAGALVYLDDAMTVDEDLADDQLAAAPKLTGWPRWRAFLFGQPVDRDWNAPEDVASRW